MEIIARLANLPGALPGACAQGLIWGIMAIGVYLTYRILDVADLTVDGSFGTGGAVCVMCLLSGMNVWAALLVAVLAGLATGLVTGLLHTFMGIPAILATWIPKLWATPPGTSFLRNITLLSTSLTEMWKFFTLENVCSRSLSSW